MNFSFTAIKISWFFFFWWRAKWIKSEVMTVACQASLSMGFSRQQYCSGLPLSFPVDLPDLGIKPESPALQADSKKNLCHTQTKPPTYFMSCKAKDWHKDMWQCHVGSVSSMGGFSSSGKYGTVEFQLLKHNSIKTACLLQEAGWGDSSGLPLVKHSVCYFVSHFSFLYSQLVTICI